MDCADQSLLSQCFAGRWVDLPYIYNALKTLRWEGVHDVIWKDDQVKNVHLLLSLKPWEEEEEGHRGISDETHKWWWEHNDRRTAEEKIMGVDDGF
ncbi:hypothetical protein RvY_12629 [Ramazzottius varieornatus]|uniref:Uncharacterized protein n=1 Tax=Ramazzottius varieornatus TaxID=947166 RepID=A0A1D1VK55_RAMVA|nr:hypothetical protein RvY_12629 [Ramazzottius varieornatus]